MYTNSDQIYILTKRTGYLHQLRMYGPIVNPLKCPVSLCMSLLISGVELFQFDPVTKNVVELNLENLLDDNKFGTKEEPVVEEEPVMQAIVEEVSAGVVIEPVKVEELITPLGNDEVENVESDEKVVDETVEEGKKETSKTIQAPQQQRKKK